jgi:peptidoglycan/xylan/chitin deacetylase (PgdA/CDA1 family)
MSRAFIDARCLSTFILSLDFELHWGIRDYADSRTARVRLDGARAAIPRILALFEEFDVAATWATVGFVFATSRNELQAHFPGLRPTYVDQRLDPYFEQIGHCETDDPFHFAPSLVELIRHTPLQEIGTHTFSHYYCNEPGQTAATFAADLRAALEIARLRGIELTSIVFPRNQHNPAYDSILLEHGIRAYRGNPRSSMWQFSGAEESAGRTKRMARLADTYISLHPDEELQRWDDVLQPSGLSDVRATTFLRPWSRRLRALEPLRIARLRSAIRRAARTNRLIHLWWHPHNFGLNTGENLAVLRALLETFAECHERYGMQSMTMSEVDAAARRMAQGTSAAQQSSRAPASVAG